jgi:hypothetical protein
MQTTTKMILAICCIGAVAVETLAPVYAQHRHRTWKGCPRGLMDAHQVTRYRAETLHPTDGDGEAGRKATC